ncbi:hypothetical protein [Conexibacter woesei]|uniref:hypothetical protein n=1 Tax=Conexibacter woesei TaxID=191495 RepID=UPI0012DCB746|nr:hypothetical protein [Conexibacter woesei]
MLTRDAWRPYWRFAKDHTGLFLAIASVLAALTYFTLAAAEQHMYGSLYIDLADVGLSRPRLIEDTAIATVIIALIFVPLSLLLSLALAAEHGMARFAIWRPAGAVLNAVGLGVITLGIIWGGASYGADQVRAGKISSGTLAWGLQVLDIWAMPFHFTRLPAGHGFDPGCVLYLGHANGQLVMYDVEHGSSLHLQEAQYAGEAGFVSFGQVPDRCRGQDDPAAVLADTEQVEDVDAAGTTLAWSERAHPHGPWALMVSTGGAERVLLESPHRLEPDLGRDPNGRLVVIYRSCAARGCVVRERPIAHGTSTTIAVPRKRGCSPAWPSESTQVVAVVLSGARCAPRDRGVWLRRVGDRWRRVPTTQTGAAELDTSGDRVIWVEDRGPLDRLRVVAGGRTATLASGRQPLTTPRLVRGGPALVGRRQRPAEGAVLASRRLRGEAGQGHRRDDRPRSLRPLVTRAAHR